MPATAYVDQNCLSKVADDPARLAVLSEATLAGRVTLVLSPWHFYEFGIACEDRRERLLHVVETLAPSWVLERFDLLAEEFAWAWCRFYGDKVPDFTPVRSFEHVTAAFAKVKPPRMQGISMRDFVNEFVSADRRVSLQRTLDAQARVAEANSESYRLGKMTKALLRRVDERHLAFQFAHLENRVLPEELGLRANDLLTQQPFKTMIEVFIYWCGINDLKAYRVESYLSERLYIDGGALGTNNFVDRQHAIMGMPYCDLFVTSDKGLGNRCRRMKGSLGITLAEVLTVDEFMERVAKV